MIPRHDPYRPIFSELCDINDIDDHEQIRESLVRTQPYVRSLRKAYENTPSQVDYSCPHNRAAYLLAYYPHYIEVVHHILDALSEKYDLELFNQPRLRACFFGAGPAPEVLGWISYLSVHAPTAEYAIAYLFDKYVNEWSVGREITRYHLAPYYWPNGNLITRPIDCDLLTLQTRWDDIKDKAIKTSSLFVMQNCLNDLLNSLDRLLESLYWLFQQIPPGSLFLLADVYFEQVKHAMCKIESALVDSGLATVLRSAHDGVTEFRSNIDFHPVLEEDLFRDDDGLRPRRRTRFHSLVLRVWDESEIPF